MSTFWPSLLYPSKNFDGKIKLFFCTSNLYFPGLTININRPFASVTLDWTTLLVSRLIKRTVAKSTGNLFKELYTKPHFSLFLHPNNISGWRNNKRKKGRKSSQEINGMAPANTTVIAVGATTCWFTFCTS